MHLLGKRRKGRRLDRVDLRLRMPRHDEMCLDLLSQKTGISPAICTYFNERVEQALVDPRPYCEDAACKSDHNDQT